VGKPEGKRPLRRPRRRWVDNIEIDLREMGWEGASGRRGNASTSNREVLNSNFDRNTGHLDLGFRGFPQSIRVNAVRVLRFVQFLILKQLHHSKLCSVDTESVIKQTIERVG
jgi:hypothetical protein